MNFDVHFGETTDGKWCAISGGEIGKGDTPEDALHKLLLKAALYKIGKDE